MYDIFRGIKLVHLKTIYINRLVSGSEDGTIKLWNLSTGAFIGTLFNGNENTVSCLHHLFDNKTVISGGKDGIIKAKT